MSLGGCRAVCPVHGSVLGPRATVPPADSPRGATLLGLCLCVTARRQGLSLVGLKDPQSSSEEGREFCEALGSKRSMCSRGRSQIWDEEGGDPTPSTSFPPLSFPHSFSSLHPPPAHMSIHYASTILCPHSACGEKPGYRLMKDSASSLTLAREAGHNLQKFHVIHSTSHPPPHNLTLKPMGERTAPAPRLNWRDWAGD